MTKEKFSLEDVDFEPTLFHHTLSHLELIDSFNQKISEGEFDDATGDFHVVNELRIGSNKCETAIHNAQQDICDKFTNEFYKKIMSFVALAKHGLIKKNFPFYKWVEEAINIEKLLGVSNAMINVSVALEGIYEIHQTNPDKAIDVFTDFLHSNADREARNTWYFYYLDFAVKKMFPHANLAKLLTCSCEKSIKKALLGKNTLCENESRITDAASIITVSSPKNSDSFGQTFENGMTLETHYGTKEGFRAKCKEFYNSDIWQTVTKSDSMTTKFARKFISSPTAMNNFFNTSKNIYVMKSKLNLNDVKEGMLTIFFDEVIKSNTKLGYFILDMIELELTEKVKEKFMKEKEEINKVLSYHSLQKNLNQKDVTDKRIKV